MTSRYALSFIEIDTQLWSRNSPDAPPDEQTFRFAIDADFIPDSFASVTIPSIKEIKINPALVSLGGDLGQRASVTVTFKDHRYKFASESVSSGTFWGKFRARYGIKLRGHNLRLIRGKSTDALANMETRHFIIDAQDGPNNAGEYQIIAKDVLKFADGDRAQAPVLNTGSLLADITNVATSATLTPTGIGNLEYPASGVVAIGGSEICTFTRAGDVLTLTRAQFNTVAAAHTAGDRVQVCLSYSGVDVANIISDLFVTYADVPSGFIPLTDWTTETAAYLGVVYTALIAEPTDVDKLISELIEQAALAIWWDDINQKIRLQVLRAVASTAATFTMDQILQGSLDVTEQPDKRISQAYVYFGKINPLTKEDQIDNYRSNVLVRDAQAEIDYGSASIKKIYSRWIPAGGRITAQTMANKQLGRYRDPPRRFKFDLLRDAQADPTLGQAYQLQYWQLQTMTGVAATVPIQIFSLTPEADIFTVEAEEMLWTPQGGDVNPNTRTIVFDADEDSVNLRTRHDLLYPVPVAGNIVNAIVYSGIRIGSTSISIPALDIGTWPAGVTVTLTVLGRIEGHGGDGGHGGVGFNPGAAGGSAGTALFVRRAITLTDASGQIWGGGGGGGGGGSGTGGFGGPGGGGGAGKQPGSGGAPGQFVLGGSGGTFDAPGAGGPAYPPNGVGAAGAGGGPGLSGAAGANGAASLGGAAGAAGIAIDGISFVTTSGSPGDRRGSQIN